MKKIIGATLILSMVLFSYGLFISVSDNREYGDVSLDYYLLTPEYLANIAKLCKSSPRYEYGSADGPKPAIVHLSCTLSALELVDYLDAHNFKEIGNNNYKKGDFELGFDVDDESKVLMITGYEYL